MACSKSDLLGSVYRRRQTNRSAPAGCSEEGGEGGGRAKIVFSSRLQAVTDGSRGWATPPKSVISFGRPPSVDTLAMHSGLVGCKNTSRRFISFWDEPKSFSKSFKCQFLLVLFFVNFLMPWTRLAAVGPQRGRLVRARCVYFLAL